MNFQPRIRSASEPNPGVECCTSNDPNLRCDKCKAHFGTPRAASFRTNIQEATVKHDYSAPDPYARDIATIRAAAATPASTFEEQYKADRLRELDAERAHIDAHIANPRTRLTANPRTRLTAAELAAIPAPPDPYAAGLAAMRKEQR